MRLNLYGFYNKEAFMDMCDNYRLIEEAKVRSVERISNGIQLNEEDVVTKIERNNGSEDYYAGFSDYHDPR